MSRLATRPNLLFSLAFLPAVLLVAGSLLADPEEKTKEESPAKPPLKLKIGELFGQSPAGKTEDQEVKLSAEFKVAENGRDGLISVKAIIAEGWHVYSVTQPKGGPNASKLSIAKGDQLEAVGSFAADREPHVRELEGFNVPIEEHDEEVVWSAPITLKDGIDPQTLVLSVRYDGQVCTDGIDNVGGACKFMENVAVSAKYAGKLTSAPPKILAPSTGEAFRLPGEMLTLEGKTDKSTVARGGKMKLSITATPDADWFVYALEKRDPKLVSKPVLIVFTETHGLVVGEPIPSAPPKVKQTGIPTAPEAKYYTDPITWTTELTVPKDAKAGSLELVGLFGFQTCTKAKCLPPSAAEFRVTLEVGDSDDATGKPLAFAAPEKQIVEGKPVSVSYNTVANLAAKESSGALDLAKISVDSDTANMPLYWVLPIALLGGFILNFMPCVLPVIGLKILSFVQQAGESRARIFALNLWYSLGMLAVFMVLATLAVVWNLGWGEQNNSVGFNVPLVCVVFAMGLSFLGVWEIPIPGFVGGDATNKLAQKEGPVGAFFKGALTTVLATPCSGPGLATALAWCNGKPPHLVYLVFVCLGIGMAFPYIVIGMSPSLVKLLPRPGAWMESFKQVMGFVLLGVVVFIMTYMPAATIVPTVAFLFGLWAALWWIGRTPVTAELSQTLKAWAGGAVLAGAVGAFATLWLAPYMQHRFVSAVDREISQRQGAASAPAAHAARSEHELPWQPFSFDRLGKLTAENKTVLVDFTADWCLTCKALESTVLNTKNVKQAVEKHQVETLVADWTNKDPQIGELLEALGSSKQIPVLAIFPAGRPNKPIVLIGGYTQGSLIKRIEEAVAIAADKGENSTAMK